MACCCTTNDAAMILAAQGAAGVRECSAEKLRKLHRNTSTCFLSGSAAAVSSCAHQLDRSIFSLCWQSSPDYLVQRKGGWLREQRLLGNQKSATPCLPRLKIFRRFNQGAQGLAGFSLLVGPLVCRAGMELCNSTRASVTRQTNRK